MKFLPFPERRARLADWGGASRVRTMVANTQADETANDNTEEYLPAKNLTPEEVYRAAATLSEEEFEQMNECGLTVDADSYADRVLVSLNVELAERVRRHAWRSDREPNAVLDAFLKHGDRLRGRTQPARKMTDVACHLCGYEWEYSGGLPNATCPNCTRKTPAENGETAP